MIAPILTLVLASANDAISVAPPPEHVALVVSSAMLRATSRVPIASVARAFVDSARDSGVTFDLVDTPAITDCEGRLQCLALLAHEALRPAPSFLVVVSLLPRGDRPDLLSVFVVDVDRALREIALVDKDAPDLEREREARVYE